MEPSIQTACLPVGRSCYGSSLPGRDSSLDIVNPFRNQPNQRRLSFRRHRRCTQWIRYSRCVVGDRYGHDTGTVNCCNPDTSKLACYVRDLGRRPCCSLSARSHYRCSRYRCNYPCCSHIRRRIRCHNHSRNTHRSIAEAGSHSNLVEQHSRTGQMGILHKRHHFRYRSQPVCSRPAASARLIAAPASAQRRCLMEIYLTDPTSERRRPARRQIPRSGSYTASP